VCLYAGQVCGVAISSALFQTLLESALRARIHGPNADEVSNLPRPSKHDACTLTTIVRIADHRSDSTLNDAGSATPARLAASCEGLIRRRSPCGVFPSGVFDVVGVHCSNSGQCSFYADLFQLPCCMDVRCLLRRCHFFRFLRRNWRMGGRARMLLTMASVLAKRMEREEMSRWWVHIHPVRIWNTQYDEQWCYGPQRV
jgi:hypothetical protein